MSIFLLIYFIVMVVILFGITIFVHELGHFWVARKLGMHANVFSIGFGHAIWKKEKDGVVYKVGWIPFGGYVSLPQMEPGRPRYTDEHGKEIVLPRIEPWKKIAVALAGAAGNILLAVVLAVVVFWVGKPSTLQESSSAIGFVEPDSAAYQAGLRTGDEIVAVNGQEVDSWDDINLSVALSESPTIDLTVRPRGQEAARRITLDAEYGALGVQRVKGLPGIAPPAYCVVGRTLPGSSAAEADLQPGDLMLSLNGQPLHSPAHMKEVVQGAKGQAVPLVIERGGQRQTVMVTPQWNEEEEEARIGVAFNPYHFSTEKLVHPSPWEQIKGHASLIFTTLRALVTPSTAKDAANAIGGPPMIFYYIYAMLKTSFKMALWFTCLLNVNLAIINLLPFPVLDGGHVVFALIEWVARRPVHERVVNAITTACALLLIAAMLFLSVRDLNTMWGWRNGGADEPPDQESVPDAPAGSQ